MQKIFLKILKYIPWTWNYKEWLRIFEKKTHKKNFYKYKKIKIKNPAKGFNGNQSQLKRVNEQEGKYEEII